MFIFHQRKPGASSGLVQFLIGVTLEPVSLQRAGPDFLAVKKRNDSTLGTISEPALELPWWEKGKSELCCFVMRHGQQFEKTWLAGFMCLKVSMCYCSFHLP